MQKYVLSIRQVSKKYRKGGNEVSALKSIDLDIPQGSVYGIIGKNGAGKSTLFRCLTGLEKFDQGSIILDGEEIQYRQPESLRHFRQHIGVVFQQLHLFSSRTVWDNIAYPLEIEGIPASQQKPRIEQTLSLLGLSGKEHKYPAELSGGEKQRVAIARAVIHEPKILLCDEATSALDPETLSSTLEVLRSLHTQLKMTILIITHQTEIVSDLCTHVAYLKKGKIEQHGPKEWIANRFHSTDDSFIAEFIGGAHV